MTTTDGIPTPLYKHLRLPDHFGYDPDALYDCLRDLKWINAEYILLVVDDADDLLRETPEGRSLLLTTWHKFAAHWPSQARPSGPGDILPQDPSPVCPGCLRAAGPRDRRGSGNECPLRVRHQAVQPVRLGYGPKGSLALRLAGPTSCWAASWMAWISAWVAAGRVDRRR
ncbi:barstar family protein [Streptomyces sp. NPDC050523]|uniref:barstar family protein n=1 Tax=Streptomyces sp. NPDC050523 TaxID=3365622 RepID=UPI003797EEBF